MNTIRIYSDLICPWCYIGKRRMEEALRQVTTRTQIERSWHPFQLNPDMPPAGMDRKAYRSRKFGSWERSQAMDSEVAATGRAVGIEFRYDLQTHTPNTFDSHRVVWLAGRSGVQEGVVESLFHAYFCEGANFSDPPVLIAAAASGGLEAGRVKRLLESDEGASVVRIEEERGRSLGISGVPFFIFNQQIAFSGAQAPAAFLEALRRASERPGDLEERDAAGSADACGPSGCDVPP